MKTCKFVVFVAVLAVAGAASAQQLSWNFEGVTVADLEDQGWFFEDEVGISVDGVVQTVPGTVQIETEIYRSGGAALRLGLRDIAYFPLNGQFGTLELWVYDHGYRIAEYWGTAAADGPRFGLEKRVPASAPFEDEYYSYGIGAGQLHRSWLNSDNGYGIEWGNTTDSLRTIRENEDHPAYNPDAEAWSYHGWPGTQTWFTHMYAGVVRPDWETGGGWNHWRVAYVAPGQIEITLLESWAGATNYYTPAEPNATNPFVATMPGGVDSIYLYGGTTFAFFPDTLFGDGIFDDITWTPLDAPPACIPGDANCDGVVDLDDFVILKNNFGATDATWEMGDFNEDGVVDLDDFVILKNNFGATAPVPEPMTLSLLALGGLAVLRRRR